jgi:tight adherence protein B
MIIACLLATGLAVVLLIPPPADRAVTARLTAGDRPEPRARRPWRAIGLGSVAVTVLLVLGGFWVGGPPGAVVATAAAVVAGTAARLLVLRRSRRLAARRRTEVARGCATIAAQVRVGRVPGEALTGAAADWPVLEQANQVRLLGGDVPDALVRQSAQPGCGGLADLARAWRLATETGAPMAGVLDQVALALRRDEALQRTVAAELAGPRATGKVMAVLPFCGVGIGYLLGGRPVEFLLQGPLGWACLLGGVLLACGGVLWVSRLARVAEDA